MTVWRLRYDRKFNNHFSIPGLLLRPIVIVLALLLSPTLAAEIYKWTDESGQIHYGSSAGADDADTVKVTPAPALPDNHALRQEKQRRLLNLFDDEREEKREAKTQALQEKEIRLANCQRGRDYYETIKISRFLYDVDESGNQVILDETSRQAEETRIMQYIDEWCD